MKLGTKSVLYGVHAFWLHPFFVAVAWTRLYGFPWDPRLWIAFLVHDIGYVGKPNMDGEEGEMHPLVGARIMSWLFDSPKPTHDWSHVGVPRAGRETEWFGRWGQFVLFHSRFLAKRSGFPYSRLCVADKLALAITPAWIYLPMARATGEIHEYMAQARHREEGNAAERRAVLSGRQRDWYRGVQAYVRRWVEEHKDGKRDEWTPAVANRAALGEDGVWR
jgi:hypothetical protein